MSDTATIISSVCGMIVALIGGVRMLLSYYFKMQERLRRQDQTIKSMEIQELKSMIDSLKAKIANFETKVDVLTAKIRINAESSERVIQAQTAFVSSTEKRIKAIELDLENVKVGHVIVKGGK